MPPCQRIPPHTRPLFEPHGRRSERREGRGPGGFCPRCSLLTLLPALATLTIKSSSGLGFLKVAPFSPSYEAGSCKDIVNSPPRSFLPACRFSWAVFLLFLFMMRYYSFLLTPELPLQGASQPQLCSLFAFGSFPLWQITPKLCRATSHPPSLFPYEPALL